MEVPVKRMIHFCLMSLIMLSGVPAFADTAELMSRADALFTYKNGNVADYQASEDLYKEVLAAEPDNFEAAWKCARSIRYYAVTAQQTGVDGWKDICAKAGKEGMAYAQKAIDLNPDRPDGYYYYALNVGVYADGVSIITALKEGLKDKTQTSFEKVLELDPDYEKAGALVGIGRFWSVLPWPLTKKKKALEYYRQYQTTPYYGKDPEGIIYISELLIDLGGKENKEEARQILALLDSTNPFFTQYRETLLAKL